MKRFWNFLFNYSSLNWKTRLSQRDHLYHQGRALVGVIVTALPAGGVAGYVLSTPTPSPTYWAFLGLLVLLAMGALYIIVMSIKLTVMRLHDFNRSGWWAFGLLGLSVIDGLLSKYVLPDIDAFVSLNNLAYLALLLVPANAVANRFGVAEVNSTAGKPNWVRLLPLVVTLGMWLIVMASMLVNRLPAPAPAPTSQYTEIKTEELQDMQDFSKEMDADTANNARRMGISPTVLPVSITAPVTITPTLN